MTEVDWGLPGEEVLEEAEPEFIKRHKEFQTTYYCDYGNGFTGVYICQNLPNCTL